MGLFSKKKLPAWNPGTLGSITQGKVMPVTEVKDEVFPRKCWETVWHFFRRTALWFPPVTEP